MAATYTAISTTAVSAYQPITGKLITRLRDNVYAGRITSFSTYLPVVEITASGNSTAAGYLYIPDCFIGSTSCSLIVNWTRRNYNTGVGELTIHPMSIGGVGVNPTQSTDSLTTTDTTLTYTGSAGLQVISASVQSAVGTAGGKTTINWVRMELTP